MPRKKEPGSLASEAARLTVELSDRYEVVTVEMVRWWKKKGYPLNDTPELKRRLGNQERRSNPKKSRPSQGKPTESASDDDFRPTLAFQLITDEMIAAATETITVGEVLDYLRDAWEGQEWHSARYANKSEAEIAAMVQRDIKFSFASLPDLLKIDVPGADKVMREISQLS